MSSRMSSGNDAKPMLVFLFTWGLISATFSLIVAYYLTFEWSRTPPRGFDLATFILLLKVSFVFSPGPIIVAFFLTPFALIAADLVQERLQQLRHRSN